MLLRSWTRAWPQVWYMFSGEMGRSLFQYPVKWAMLQGKYRGALQAGGDPEVRAGCGESCDAGARWVDGAAWGFKYRKEVRCCGATAAAAPARLAASIIACSP